MNFFAFLQVSYNNFFNYNENRYKFPCTWTYLDICMYTYIQLLVFELKSKIGFQLIGKK